MFSVSQRYHVCDRNPLVTTLSLSLARSLARPSDLAPFQFRNNGREKAIHFSNLAKSRYSSNAHYNRAKFFLLRASVRQRGRGKTQPKRETQSVS